MHAFLYNSVVYGFVYVRCFLFINLDEDERLKWTAKRSAASFSSLAGIDSTIEDVRKNVERPLKFPHLYASLGIEPPRQISPHHNITYIRTYVYTFE